MKQYILYLNLPDSYCQIFLPTENNRKYERYQALAKAAPHVILAGRLANYRYWDMDQAINNSFDTFEGIKKDFEKER